MLLRKQSKNSIDPKLETADIDVTNNRPKDEVKSKFD
jgi:hypothetical protein